MGINKNNLRFVSLGISAFAGITKNTKVNVTYPEGFDISQELNTLEKENGLVLVFPEGYGYVEIEGDQGAGKTSFINCLREACGGLADANNINVDVNDKNFRDRFWGVDGYLYQFKITKSTITLERIETDEEGNPVLNAKNQEIKVVIPSPKAMLQKIVGPAGIDPMSLKQKSGAEQVQWLRSLYSVDVETERFYNDIKTKYDVAFKERTTANKSSKELETLLNNNTYYKNYETWDKYFAETKYEDLQREVVGVQQQYSNYEKAKNAIPLLTSQRDREQKEADDIQAEIDRLIVKRDAKLQSVREFQDRIDSGNTYLNDNISIIDQYNGLKEKIDEAGSYQAHKLSFDQMKDQKAKWDAATDDVIRLNGKLTEYEALKKDFVKQFSPEIPDFELCIADEADKREGLFYKKKPLSILAESELWEFATQLWKVLGVKIIYVDNISTLGTGAVNKFNEFLQQGGAYIFGVKMNRGEQNLKISFHNKIPI